ncbi:ATP-binding protein [Marinibacterium profundimaris]|uniref:Histidine kinase/HSP90-like ATPase domain-containing protein n=1 Tax=Marinibacterium profundimaris TaxID=1679460 RepID=A0A225NNG8_9RHOB|nr:ATP-binding protein [Marinibacterium profundimaris]OWU73719.1 hypothetical protein ATO3_13055 [Marinibacterium profundimaris]
MLSLTSEATETGTRAALSRIMRQLRADLAERLSPERAGMVEIALAEIINNIVEHAYRRHDGGEIRLSAHVEGPALKFDITDDGDPLPGGVLPHGRSSELTCPRDSLPEGGFGWLLIRAMASDIRYDRRDGTNRLHVAFDLRPADPAT